MQANFAWISGSTFVVVVDELGATVVVSRVVDVVVDAVVVVVDWAVIELLVVVLDVDVVAGAVVVVEEAVGDDSCLEGGEGSPLLSVGSANWLRSPSWPAVLLDEPDTSAGWLSESGSKMIGPFLGAGTWRLVMYASGSGISRLAPLVQ